MRRKRNHSQHELWQIVYLDFVTTVMIFFFAMWVVSKTQSKSKNLDEGNSRVIDFTLRDGKGPKEVFFESGSVQLTEWGKKEINEQIVKKAQANLIFKADPSESMRPLLFIEGHTDDVGKKADNFMRGYQRALAASNHIGNELERAGKKGFFENVAICSFADNMPNVGVAPSIPDHLAG